MADTNAPSASSTHEVSAFFKVEAGNVHKKINLTCILTVTLKMDVKLFLAFPVVV